MLTIYTTPLRAISRHVALRYTSTERPRSQKPTDPDT